MVKDVENMEIQNEEPRVLRQEEGPPWTDTE